MGIALGAVIYLQRNGFLSDNKNRPLDIGPQTMYSADTRRIAGIIDPAAVSWPVQRLF